MEIEVDADNADLIPFFSTCLIPVDPYQLCFLTLTFSFYNREAKDRAGGMDQD